MSILSNAINTMGNTETKEYDVTVYKKDGKRYVYNCGCFTSPEHAAAHSMKCVYFSDGIKAEDSDFYPYLEKVDELKIGQAAYSISAKDEDGVQYYFTCSDSYIN